jgi:hypothetical protein
MEPVRKSCIVELHWPSSTSWFAVCGTVPPWNKCVTSQWDDERKNRTREKIYQLWTESSQYRSKYFVCKVSSMVVPTRLNCHFRDEAQLSDRVRHCSSRSTSGSRVISFTEKVSSIDYQVDGNLTLPIHIGPHLFISQYQQASLSLKNGLLQKICSLSPRRYLAQVVGRCTANWSMLSVFLEGRPDL